jgi:glycerol-3-phosphate O-acyltransferase/dihydroxyacetone phosphate acyltransferase
MIRPILERAICLLVRVFFRRLEVSGQEHVPATGPVLFVLNHPNALVDPVVLLCRAGRPVAFLAKEPLFRTPVISIFVRALDSIPVYRRMDQADTSRNRATFEAARALLAAGGSLAVFPEGTSHSDPRLKPFRTGAARIALATATDAGLPVVPAGLFYTAKTRFRSSALLCFGPPILVTPVPPDPDGEPPAAAVRELTRGMESSLGKLTLQADQHEALRLVESAERIFRSATPEREWELTDRLRLRRRFLAGAARLREQAPDRMEAIESRIARYQAALEQAELSPELLPTAGYRWWIVLRVTLRALAKLLVLLPVAIVGMVLHLPGWMAIELVSRRYERSSPDMVATVKALGGLVFYGATWIVLAWVAGSRWGWPGVVAGLIGGPVSGLIALQFLERADRLRGGARGVLLALTGQRRFLRLVAERRAIRDALVALGDEFAL